MNKLDATRTGVRFIVGISTSFVVANVIKNNTTPDTKFQKAEVVVGAFVIGGLVAIHAEKYAMKMFNNTIESIQAIKEETEK